MKLSSQLKLFVCSAAIATASVSQATVFDAINKAQSKITFGFQQMGVNMEGQFNNFDGELSFDTEQPEQSSVNFKVYLDSVDLGSPPFNDEVAGKDWFNTKAFPVAEFASTAVKAEDGNRLLVKGNLTIKGQTETIEFPVSFQESNGLGILQGQFVVQRGKFKIGEGSWSSFDIVANPVSVQFTVAAEPKQ